ncbi:MAG: RNA-binding protein, partial [Gammaproteobacteria bacterium]
MQQNKLYVGNFPYSVDEDQLREMFSPYGEIEELALIMDRETGRSKGFAFITFETQQAAES